MKKETKKEIFSWIWTLAVAFVIALFLNHYIIVNANVPTGSMENTIQPGDRLIGFRLSYQKEGPKRGDIIIFNYPVDESEIYIKRVIGLPGETLEIRDAKVYIDHSETPLAEPYAMNPCDSSPFSTAPYYREARVTLPQRQTACRMWHCCARRIDRFLGRRKLGCTPTRWAERHPQGVYRIRKAAKPPTAAQQRIIGESQIV